MKVTYMVLTMSESTFSYCPYVGKTYSSKGIRPILTHHYHRGGIQAIGVVTLSGKIYYDIKSDTMNRGYVNDYYLLTTDFLTCC